MTAARCMLWLLVGATLAGCRSLPPIACAADEEARVSQTLYFGTQSPRGPVTPEQWREFLADVVTPRFPQGLSVWSASGQWRGADGAIVREDSYVLTLVHADDVASHAAVRAIADAYRARFAQEAVLRVRTPACTAL